MKHQWIAQEYTLTSGQSKGSTELQVRVAAKHFGIVSREQQARRAITILSRVINHDQRE